MREAVVARNEALLADAAERMKVTPDDMVIVQGCDFCGRDETEVTLLIAGVAIIPDTDVHICDECVGVCVEVVADFKRGSAPPPSDRGE